MSDTREQTPLPNAPESLRRSLASIGVVARVEARERLAVLIASDPSALLDAELRRRALVLAREHGFTNLALEIGESSTARAALSGD
jgi:hypothetical protein